MFAAEIVETNMLVQNAVCTNGTGFLPSVYDDAPNGAMLYDSGDSCMFGSCDYVIYE